MATDWTASRRVTIGDRHYTAVVDVDAWAIVEATARRAERSKGRTATALGGGITVRLSPMD